MSVLPTIMMSPPTASEPTYPSHGENLPVRNDPWCRVPPLIPAAICDAERCSANILPPPPLTEVFPAPSDLARLADGASSAAAAATSSSSISLPATRSMSSGASSACSLANCLTLSASTPSSLALSRFPRSLVRSTMRLLGMARW